MGHCPSVHEHSGSILLLKLAPAGTRFTLETRFMGDHDIAIARSFDEDLLCTAIFSCTSHSGASLAFLPASASSGQTHLLLDTSRTDPVAVPPHCAGGTWCCLAREACGAGEQRLVSVVAARLLPSESPCPSISRQGYFWWPA